MNAAYAYNNQEAALLITNRIYYLLEQNQWSVKTLSDKSNIPYETLKKLLSRKTENTSFHNIMKIALAFNCNLNYFVEPMVNHDNCPNTSSRLKVSLYYPKSSTMCNPVSLPGLSIQDTLDISYYPKYMQDQIHYGIVISTYSYHPVYTANDVLLINCNRAPIPGETGIFSYEGNLYIRIFHTTYNTIILKPVNGVGHDIIIHDFSQWKMMGYVIGVHKLTPTSSFDLI